MPDYVRHCPSTPNTEVRSFEDFREFLVADRKAFPDQKAEVVRLIAEGDYVAFWATYEGTQKGQVGPYPPSNKFATVEFSGFHRFENGKIAESWLIWDNVSILVQLGHIERAAAGVEK